MTTITISREYGSGGAAIARQVANSLDYDFVDKQVIEGIFRQYGLTKFKDLYTSAPGFWDLTNATNLLIVSMLNEIMEALARRGHIVILGRGGFASLGNYADVLNVRIQAPPANRIERVMAREQLTHRQQAEERVTEDDKARRKFIQMFYNKRWDTESLFHLVIDTGSVSPELAVNWIVDAAKELAQKQFTPTEVTASRAQVDPVLVDAINQVISPKVR